MPSGAEPGEYVLVCTDCLAEGINLQQHFNAVLHYDLAWNPTRHEQREGRVDRFGQEKPQVRVVTYYGTDNPIDGVILDVLIRKHKSIKSDLGVTVAVPGSSEQIAEALFEGALFRKKTAAQPQQLTLRLLELESKKQAIHAEWDNARDREKASRSRFAHHTLSPEAVAAELKVCAPRSAAMRMLLVSSTLFCRRRPFRYKPRARQSQCTSATKCRAHCARPSAATIRLQAALTCR